MLPFQSTGTTAFTALGILLGTASHAVYAQSSSSGSDDSNDCSILNDVQFFYYGVPTNNNGTVVAYSCGDSQHSAGGNGTLEDPLTIVADTESGEFEQCEVLYSPTLRKYLQVKDPCLDCGRDGINVWFGGDEEDDEGQAQCNAEIATSDGVLIKNPAELYQVDSDPIWDGSTCHKDNVYKGAEGECIEDTETTTTPAPNSSPSTSPTSPAASETTSTSPSTTDAAASETSAPSSQDSTSEADSTSDYLSAGAIAGIVIGSIGAMALIAIAVLLWRRHSRDGHHGEEKGPVYHEMPANTHDEAQELESDRTGLGIGMGKAAELHTSSYDPVELPANDQHFASDVISPLSPERISQV